MGFAVMLNRANATGRPFLVPYIRRVIGLGLFGMCTTRFFVAGDILFSYAFLPLACCTCCLGWKSFPNRLPQ